MTDLTPRELNDLLPFLLRRENVARYKDGEVMILDRRKFPFERVFVHCPDVESVARAIEAMVTQGGGPSRAALYALAGVARRVQSWAPEAAWAELEAARQRLAHTRPTNTALHLRLQAAMQVLEKAMRDGQPLEANLLSWIESLFDRALLDYAAAGRHGAGLIEDGDGILTMCFAETAFIFSLIFAWQSGKRIHVYTPETRPYLQGARLTAPCVHELGIPVTVIGDSMPGSLMAQGKVQKYFTAADLVTLDGHVVNKVGTYQLAIAARYHDVPYYVFAWGYDPHKPDRASIEIELRDPREMKTCRGNPTTLDEIEAYYPAFDITPPELVAGVITKEGVRRME